jgi:ribosomal protein S18 acetylase RimI-like enzyme
MDCHLCDAALDPDVTLRPVDRAELAIYVDTAAASLAAELVESLRLAPEVARDRADESVRSLIPNAEPSSIRKHVYLCAVISGGATVGFALFGRQPKSGRRYFVWDIAIDPDRRGLGLGRATMEAIEERARADGAEVIELNVFERNPIARSLYESLGYQAASSRMIKAL